MSTANPRSTDDRRRLRRFTFAVWGNPLARTADRTEATLAILVVGIWLLALPIVAAGGSLWWPEASAAAMEEQHTRVSTSAVLTANAADFLLSAQGNPISGQVPVPARWVALDGSERTGTVSATGGAKSGDTVQVWVDRSGNLAAAPMSSTGAAILVVVAATGAWLAIGALLATCWLTLRWRLNLRRLARWDDDWKRVEPQWSGRS